MKRGIFEYGDHGWLYAFGTKDGRVKIGRSQSVTNRLTTYRYQHDIEWAHIFGRVQGWNACKRAERAAIAAVESKSSRVRKTEWFIGADKSEVIVTVRTAINAVAK